MSFQRLVSLSPTELFVLEVKKMILSGELKKEERLPTVKQLSEQMHVSRAVISSGIKILERQGFLRVAPRKGVYVADLLTSGNLETLQAIIEYGGQVFAPDIVEPIFQFRYATECEMLVETAQHCTDEEAEELCGRLKNLRDTENPADCASQIYQFYHQAGVISHNLVYPLLVATFRPIYLPLLEIMVRLDQERRYLTYMEQIALSVKSRAPKQARQQDADFIEFCGNLIRNSSQPGKPYTTPVS